MKLKSYQPLVMECIWVFQNHRRAGRADWGKHHSRLLAGINDLIFAIQVQFFMQEATPILNTIRCSTGYMISKNLQVKVTPSRAAKMKNRINVNPKLIMAETYFDNRKIYFGTLILEKICRLLTSELIPPVADSLKNTNSRLPKKDMWCNVQWSGQRNW